MLDIWGIGRSPRAAARKAASSAALAALALLLLGQAGPAAADDPFGFLNDIVEDATDALSTDNSSSSSGSNAPADIGAAPTAIVDEAAGLKTQGIAEFSYLQPGQQIEVGPQGTLRLTYFSSCAVEVIHGGTVTVGTVSSVVTGGKVERSTTECQAQQVAVTSSTEEVGASVKRVTPFDPAVWAEATVSTQTPSFSWGGGKATLRIVELDAPQEHVAWEGKVKGPTAAYPKDAPPLQVGMPYRVEIESAGGPLLSAVFSVDPGYTGNGAKTDVVSLVQ